MRQKEEGNGLTHERRKDSVHLEPDYLKRLYKGHVRGAFVRSGASTFVWFYVFISFLIDSVSTTAFIGVSASVVSIILMNFPLLAALKRVRRRHSYEFCSLLANVLEVIGYTGVIYFLGGLRATYISPIYAAVITYVGVVAPRRFPFIVAGFCAILFSSTVILEHFGLIPHQNSQVFSYQYNLLTLALTLIMFTAALYVVAFVSAYTGGLLRKARHRVTEKNIQLEIAIEKARESERLKSQFLANMSHEIRTPMNAVMGFTDMLLDSNLNEEQIDFAVTAKRSGEALLSLINDILDLSKIEAGEFDFQEIDFDPELLAYDVCEIIRPRIGLKRIEILCRIGDSLPSHVKGDPLRLRQVLTNLMGNSTKFTESGEIELSLDVEEEKDDKVKLHAIVRDTGIGIPEERLSAIFMPFEQADGSTTRKYGGSGLGLSLCKQISNLMGGEVWGESEVDKGSTFHFTGWLGKAEEKKAKRFAPVSLSGRKVLIIDDNRSNLDILRHVLELFDMRVVDEEKPAKVLGRLQEALHGEDPYDICIVDIMMPGMSGYELAKEIRDPRYKLPNIPLIALSSLMERDAQRCEEAGFDAFLSKPFRREKLFHMLERILGKREEEGEKAEAGREKIMTQYTLREEMKRSVRILLVEDNPVNQKLAKMMLIKGGYQVEVANDGKEAVEKFTGSPEEFDLIFMDIQMPRMDGMEATKVIREKGFDAMPIVAMTAHAMKGDREKCLEGGMDDYITKPIKRELVFEILEKWVFKKGKS